MSKIILTTHQKGGVGKSTLTFNMASALKNDVSVCIIDLDLQGSLYRTKEASDVPIFSSEYINKIEDLDYDFVFIDTPPYLNNELPKLSNLADAVLIPTKTGLYDLLAIEDTIEIVKNNKNKEKILIVFNMVKPNTTLTLEMKEALEKFDVKVADTMISDLVAFTRSSMNNGVEESEKALNQISNLTMEVLKIIKK